MCNCTGQCSCGSSVIPSGPQGPIGSQGPSGVSGTTNIYSFIGSVVDNTNINTYVPLSAFVLPANSLSAPVANKSDALDITIVMSFNFNSFILPPPLNAVRLNLFNNSIDIQNFVSVGDFIIKLRVSVASSSVVSVDLLATGFPILFYTFQAGIPFVKNTVLTNLNLNTTNPIDIQIYQSQTNSFTLKGFYIDKIKGA